MTIEGTVSICPTSGECTDLPSAGADAKIYNEAGQQVDKGTLDSHGRMTAEVPEGTYRATLSMPSFDIHTTRAGSAAVSINTGELAELDIAMPPLYVTKQEATAAS